jgi:hypothetical protein
MGTIPTMNGSFKKVMWWVFGVVVIVVILAVFGVIPATWVPRVNGGYQAVFLSNGQVYFGKLYRAGGQYAVLRDIYYLQVTQPPQPIPAGETPPANVNVVKLGGELHGPEDEMRINRDHILFVEDLKGDSRVLLAIEQLKGASQ